LLKKSNETSYFKIRHSDYQEPQLFHTITANKKKNNKQNTAQILVSENEKRIINCTNNKQKKKETL